MLGLMDFYRDVMNVHKSTAYILFIDMLYILHNNTRLLEMSYA